MNDEMAQAVALLQARLSRSQLTSFWRAEQAEEALNILLAQPERRDPPHYLVRNALADAAKKLKRRASIHAKFAPAAEWIGDQLAEGFDELVVEVSDLLGRGLSSSDQKLLKLACDTGETEEIAQTLGIPVARARERLSRARARARTLLEAA